MILSIPYKPSSPLVMGELQCPDDLIGYKEIDLRGVYRKMIISLIIAVFLCLYSNKKRLCRFLAEAASIFATRN